MPVNERYPLSLLMPILADYERHTGRRVFIEYLMLAGINDRPEHADELAAWLRGTQHHVNLIPYNQVAGVAWAGSLDAQVRGFQARLRAAGVPVTVRHPMGRAILAACGQLQAETQPRGRQPGC